MCLLLLLGLWGKGDSARLQGMTWVLGTLRLAAWALSLPSPNPRASGMTGADGISGLMPVTCSHAMTVGNYDLFHKESTPNFGKGGGGQSENLEQQKHLQELGF